MDIVDCNFDMNSFDDGCANCDYRFEDDCEE